jgi:hypothetical protein
VICTHGDCGDTATRIMALPMADAVFVAPYCDTHTAQVEQEGAVPAAGPALSADASKIEGIR